MNSKLEKDTSETGTVSVAPERLADTFSSLMPDGPIEIREGYADVGDQSLHYVEAGDGPLVVLLHGFPEFWFGWRLQIAAARGRGLSGGRARHAWLQPVIEAGGIRGVRRRSARRRHPRPHRSARRRVREAGRSRLGGSIAWTTAMNHPEVVDGSPSSTRPIRGGSRGTAPPEPAPEVLVLLLLRNAGTARGRGAREGLALLPTLPRTTRTRPTRRRRSSATWTRGRSRAPRPG